MKLLAFILSFYFLVLNAIPCVDIHEDDRLPVIELTQDSNGSHDHECDQCPPFCTCNCCSSPITSQTGILQLEGPALYQKLLTGYISGLVTSLGKSFWRPPEIS